MRTDDGVVLVVLCRRLLLEVEYDFRCCAVREGHVMSLVGSCNSRDEHNSHCFTSMVVSVNL